MNKNISLTEDEDRKKQVDPNLWIVPFSDFMTILMIFFLALYVLSQSSDKIRNEMVLLGLEETFGTKSSSQRKMVEFAGSIESSFQERGLQKLVNVEINAQKIRVIMAAPILFRPGSAEIGDYARPVLDELAGLLEKMPNRITVEGHTCDLPVLPTSKYKSNLELSGARAFSVIRYFVQEKKLNPDRFTVLGCGENVPLKPNDGPENRSLNRRVEIVIEK
jgi:chemotaxis protein MotB